jgi:dihydroxyacid dehydratase/phosphogluconate dehydratase
MAERAGRQAVLYWQRGILPRDLVTKDSVMNAYRLDLLVDGHELRSRISAAGFAADPPARGYARLHQLHVTQADAGCDFDFLAARSGHASTAIPQGLRGVR